MINTSLRAHICGITHLCRVSCIDQVHTSLTHGSDDALPCSNSGYFSCAYPPELNSCHLILISPIPHASSLQRSIQKLYFPLARMSSLLRTAFDALTIKFMPTVATDNVVATKSPSEPFHVVTLANDTLEVGCYWQFAQHSRMMDPREALQLRGGGIVYLRQTWD